MAKEKKGSKKQVPVVLSPNGGGRRTVDLVTYSIPDAWGAAMRSKDKKDQQIILEVWHLAHSLRTHILK